MRVKPSLLAVLLMVSCREPLQPVPEDDAHADVAERLDTIDAVTAEIQMPEEFTDDLAAVDEGRADAADSAESQPLDGELEDAGDALVSADAADATVSADALEVFDAVDDGVRSEDVAVFDVSDVGVEVGVSDVVDVPRDLGPPRDGGPRGIGEGAPTTLAPERRVTCSTMSLPSPSVTAGASDRLVLRGRVVTPTGVLNPGEVFIQGGLLSCVASSCAARAGYAGATVIDTAGVIYPGLVNAHDHPQYDFLPEWAPPRRYTNTNQWQSAAEYRAVTAPLRENESAHTCAMTKWAEIRAVFTGTTTIQGAPNRICVTRTMARNPEVGVNFDGIDTHRPNTLGIGTVSMTEAAALRADMDSGALTAYMLHLAEGTDDTAHAEYSLLLTRNLLAPALMIIHGTALDPMELQRVAASRARIVWSPRSNLLLYGRTTDVVAALDAGGLVALAPDWTPTGNPSLLAEMRFARQLSHAALGDRLGAREIFEMATARAAAAMDRPQVGSLAEGRYADVMVVPDRGCDAYETLLDAPAADVRLVLVGGRPLYGDAAVMNALPDALRARCEDITACGQAKRACIALADTTNELDRTVADVERELRTFTTPYALFPQCP